MLQIIKSIVGAELYRAEKSTLKDAVEAAVASGADLHSANLSGADLYCADLYGANLSGADLSGANLRGADLRNANLYCADLRGAHLRSADLYGANLSGADLRNANLRNADLRNADLSGTNLRPERVTPLLMLLDQPGKIRAYKLVNEQMEGPINGGLIYAVGQTAEVSNASTDVNQHCAAGINVATLDWCLREWRQGCKILIVEFTAADIAAIPTATDGKFRIHRCAVVGEKDISDIVKERA